MVFPAPAYASDQSMYQPTKQTVDTIIDSFLCESLVHVSFPDRVVKWVHIIDEYALPDHSEYTVPCASVNTTQRLRS